MLDEINRLITDLELPVQGFLDNSCNEKIKAIRELPGGDVVDVREIVLIKKLSNCGNSMIVSLKSGTNLHIQTNEEYRQRLIRYWRYFNGV